VFGGASALFDGSGDTLTVSSGIPSNLFNSDATLDFWVRFNSLPTSIGSFLSKSTGAFGNSLLLSLINQSGTLKLTIQGITLGVVTTQFSATVSLSTGVWYHIAFERNGSNANFYKDGTKLTTTDDNGTGWSTISVSANTIIGNSLDGWIDEYRVSTVSRYQGNNFTPPTEAYSGVNPVSYYLRRPVRHLYLRR
jgi:hypothetical protein